MHWTQIRANILGGVSLAAIENFSVNYSDILTSLGWALEKSSHHKAHLIGDYVSLDDIVITHSVSRPPTNRQTASREFMKSDRSDNYLSPVAARILDQLLLTDAHG